MQVEKCQISSPVFENWSLEKIPNVPTDSVDVQVRMECHRISARFIPSSRKFMCMVKKSKAGFFGGHFRQEILNTA